MPTERLSMRRIRDLLRLTFENGLSNRQVAASLGLSKGAVSMYLRRARTAGVTWPLPEALTDTALERLLFPGAPQDPEALRPMPNWAYVDAELRRPNVTRALLWEEYRTGDLAIKASRMGGQFSTPISPRWGSKLHADSQPASRTPRRRPIDLGSSSSGTMRPRRAALSISLGRSTRTLAISLRM
jgi:hypothetical protein